MKKLFLLIPVLLLVFLQGCKDDPNPFDDPNLQPPIDVVDIDTLDPRSFGGLHFKIFKPTCANSGCHDGTFEPDFRTIESSYNTLVNHPIIKNNPAGTYTYRVVPGDANMSVLYQRLMVDIDGQSGIMPLSIDPDGDWNSMKTVHIQNIVYWINNGAKDMFGNSPTTGDLLPRMDGVIAFADGSPTPLPRDPGLGPIRVPASTQSLEIRIAYSDDNTPVQNFGLNQIRFSQNINDFIGAANQVMNIATPINFPGYFGDPALYYHSITIQPSTYGSVTDFVYFRTTVQDQQAIPVEIPAQGSFQYIKEYFAFRIVP
jgi:hypothetical protein